ncbi:MAG: mCpol domain-containing protein [Solobacterium sp.]|nr:mCpol domain-containing protein [Solobacterium sp.]
MFIAIDGNSTGRKIEKLIFGNDMKTLAEFSRLIQGRVNAMEEIIVRHSGSVIMAGGDNILAEIPSFNDELAGELESAAAGEEDYAFSISTAESAAGAYLGLKYAKATGRRLVEVQFAGNGEIIFADCRSGMGTEKSAFAEP